MINQAKILKYKNLSLIFANLIIKQNSIVNLLIYSIDQSLDTNIQFYAFAKYIIYLFIYQSVYLYLSLKFNTSFAYNHIRSTMAYHKIQRIFDIIIYLSMSMNPIQNIKIIANSYKVLRPLFQVKSYLYAQVCAIKNNYAIYNVAIYVYENQQPAQSLKMLKQKLGFGETKQLGNLIFPCNHIKDEFSQKSISLFFFNDYPIPMKFYEKHNFSIQQYLQILHGGLSCLNQLHIREIVHGNIALGTSYLLKQNQQDNCKFALNILDTSYFTGEDFYEEIEEKLFYSQGQGLGLKVSYKDDLESLIYVIVHLISKGKLFTVQRYQLQWVTQSQFLRWKTCDFFKEMIQIIPPELQILKEIFTISKSLRRTQKPDYLKLMKKVILHIVNYNQKEIKKNLIRDSFKQSKVQQQPLYKNKDTPFEEISPIKTSDIQVIVQDRPIMRVRKSEEKFNQKNSFQLI